MINIKLFHNHNNYFNIEIFKLSYNNPLTKMIIKFYDLNKL